MIRVDHKYGVLYLSLAPCFVFFIVSVCRQKDYSLTKPMYPRRHSQEALGEVADEAVQPEEVWFHVSQHCNTDIYIVAPFPLSCFVSTKTWFPKRRRNKGILCAPSKPASSKALAPSKNWTLLLLESTCHERTSFVHFYHRLVTMLIRPSQLCQATLRATRSCLRGLLRTLVYLVPAPTTRVCATGRKSRLRGAHLVSEGWLYSPQKRRSVRGSACACVPHIAFLPPWRRAPVRGVSRQADIRWHVEEVTVQLPLSYMHTQYKNDPHRVTYWMGNHAYGGYLCYRLRVVARGDQNEADAKKQIKHRERGGGLRAPIGAEGCQITGFVNVKKVPGSVRINLYSPRYSVIPESVNASHWVQSLPPSLLSHFYTHGQKCRPWCEAHAPHRKNRNSPAITNAYTDTIF